MKYLEYWFLLSYTGEIEASAEFILNFGFFFLRPVQEAKSGRVPYVPHMVFLTCTVLLSFSRSDLAILATFKRKTIGVSKNGKLNLLTNHS